MAVLLRPKRWEGTPPPVVQIDRSHPLARGLVVVLPLWYGASPPQNEWYGHGSLQGTGIWAAQGVRQFADNPNTQAFKMSSLPPGLANETAMSYAVFANVASAEATYSGLLISRVGNGSAADGLITPDQTSLGINWGSEGTWNWVSGVPIPYGEWAVLGGSARIGEMLVWSPKGTATNTSYAPVNPTSPSTGWGIGGDPQQTTRCAPGVYQYALIWNRWVTADEYAELNADPYCFFAPQSPTQRYWLVSPSGGGGTINETASLAVHATLTVAAPTLALPRTAAIAVHGTLTANQSGVVNQTAALTVHGTVAAASPTLIHQATAALAVHGTLTVAAPSLVASRTAALTVHGTLTAATPTLVATQTAALTTHGTLAAGQPNLTLAQTAQITVHGTLTASQGGTLNQTANLTAHATLAAQAPSLVHQATANLTAHATLAAGAPTLVHPAAVALQARAALNAGAPFLILPRTAALVVHGTLTANPKGPAVTPGDLTLTDRARWGITLTDRARWGITLGAAMQQYIEGDLAEWTATFTDPDNNSAPVDPTTVAFYYQVTTTTGATLKTQTLTYTGATTPAPGTIARTGTGVYVIQVDTTGLPGYWTVEARSTGTGQAATLDNGKVTPAPI